MFALRPFTASVTGRQFPLASLAALLAVAACTGDGRPHVEGEPPLAVAGVAGATTSAAATIGATAGATTAVAAGGTAAAVVSGVTPGSTGDTAMRVARTPLDASKPAGSPIVRGLYVNRFAAQSRNRMKELIDWADRTEINAFVVDMKDEFGLNYRTSNGSWKRFESTEHGVVRDVRGLLDTLRAHGIRSIARIVVFKDPAAAASTASWTIRTPDGSVWRDEKGNAWVNPYNREIWNYNIGVAEELVRLGFDEIQWDYIRFPEPYRRLATQVFPGAGSVRKPDALAEFLKVAKTRLNRLGVPSTADVFGLVTTVGGPLEIGQHWEKVSPVTDVLLPMVYPSHYPRGSLGVAHPNAQPYDIIKRAIDGARVRDEKLGITAPEHVRPWLQAFSIGKPEYTAAHVTQQKRAVYDAGYDGWVLWHPGSKYAPFVAALEPGEAVTRKTR